MISEVFFDAINLKNIKFKNKKSSVFGIKAVSDKMIHFSHITTVVQKIYFITIKFNKLINLTFIVIIQL